MSRVLLHNQCMASNCSTDAVNKEQYQIQYRLIIKGQTETVLNFCSWKCRDKTYKETDWSVFNVLVTKESELDNRIINK